MIDQETLGAALSYTNKALEALKNVVHYLGVTTTTLSDGATTNPITIGDKSVTAVNGDMVFYNGTAYTWDGTEWQETLSIAQIITQIETITEEIGNLSNLTTEEKSNLVGAINEIVADIPTKLSDLADDATHRLVTDTEKSTWDAKATTTDITNAINALDVASVGGTGKYISEISEADGKISATVGTMDEVPTQDSNKPVKSGGVFSAIDDSVSLKSATGNPITLTDAANAQTEELLMTIEPVQSGSGDPSPTNVRPISGLTSGEVTRAGKNLFGNFELNKSISSETGENLDDVTGGFRTAGKIRTAGYNAISLTFLDSTYKGSFIVLQYSDSGYIGVVKEIQCTQIQYPYNITLTLNPETTYIRIKGWYATNVSSINTAQFQVTLGATLTAYEPYTATTATITFGQTVYGGSVNFKTGEVTVTHGIADLGTLTYTNDTTWNRFLSQVSGMKAVNEWSAISLYCSQYKKQSMAPGSTENNTFGSYSDSIYIRDNRFTDAAAFKTAMSGVQLCYELATPTTLTLTPAELELLKGNNTITANGAEINIEYYPDNAIGALAGRVDDVQEQIATKANITDVNTALAGKANIVNLGTISANSNTDALNKAWDALTVYNKTVLVYFQYWGSFSAMMFKYTDGRYGVAIGMKYDSNEPYVLNVNNGTKYNNTVLTDGSDVIAGLTANTLTGIDISAYSSASNQYTAPTDGYVRMELRNENQYFYLYINNTTLLGGEGHQVTNANDYMCVFVRKGMNIYYTGTVQTAVFYSLT